MLLKGDETWVYRYYLETKQEFSQRKYLQLLYPKKARQV
jgi:hypothetical protein